MTKSEIFKKAHEIAKKTVEAIGDYMVAFSLALKSIYRGLKTMAKTMQEKLEDLGLSVWQGGNNKRIYVNDRMEEVFGLVVTKYKSGNVSGAKLNGEEISNNKAWKLINSRVYFDCNKEKFVGTELKPII